MTTDSIIMNCSQSFEKFHKFLFGDTHDVGCLHSLFLLCCRVCPLGDICHHPESFLVVTACVVGYYGIQCVEAQNAAEDLNSARRTPLNKRITQPQMLIELRLRNLY